MAWVALVFAGLFKIVRAFAMKAQEGVTRPLPTEIMTVALLVSFPLLADAIWTGIGTAGSLAAGLILSGIVLM